MTMKKLFFYLTAALWILFMGLACDSDESTGSKEDLYGTWQLIELKVDYQGIPANLIEYLGLDIKFEVREDGTYILTTKRTVLEDSADQVITKVLTNVETGTWTAGSKTVTINPDDEDEEIKTMHYSVRGDIATLKTLLIHVVDQNDDSFMANIPSTMKNEDGSLKDDIPVTLVYEKISG
jgi:hypothetical protein